MAIEVITKEDLNEFRVLLLKELKDLLQCNQHQTKQWLKSTEVRKLLNISPGTLQTLRINKTLSYTKIGGTIYYAYQDIEKVLELNKVNSEQNLFNAK
jgi:DNA-binding MarR family transcriptional regulator